MRPILLLCSLAALLCWTPPAVAGPPGQGDTIAAAIDTPSAAPLMLAVNDAHATGAAPAAAPELPPSVATEVDAAKTGLNAVKERKPGWQFVLAGVLLSALVFAFRRGLLNRWPALRGDGWGWFFGAVLPLLIGACMSIAGKPLGWQTVFDALLTAGTSLLAFSTVAKGIAGKPATPTPTPSPKV